MPTPSIHTHGLQSGSTGRALVLLYILEIFELGLLDMGYSWSVVKVYWNTRTHSVHKWPT